jgi:hypothetical protein
MVVGHHPAFSYSFRFAGTADGMWTSLRCRMDASLLDSDLTLSRGSGSAILPQD